MKIKRILASLLAVTVVGANMPAISVDFPKISLTVNAADTESPLTYQTLEDGTIEITGCNSTVTTVEIPAEIDGKKVTSIGDNGFNGCSSLTKITIPNSITNIGDEAFYDCSSLTSVTMSNSVTSIGDMAFCGCKKLTSITIPDGITSIGDFTFMRCSGLTEITIPNSVTSIGDYAFDSCSSLTEITLPDGVTSIGTQAFYKCSNLTSITIPDSVTSIGQGAFWGCSGLTSITIPDSITSIGGLAFQECWGLKSITIPDSVTSIGSNAFYHCSGLTSISIPESVTSIGQGAFNGCSSLTSVTIPDNVTSIGVVAFAYCTKLSSINVSENNKNFSEIDGVLFNKDKTELLIYPYGKSETYTIPDGVTSISDDAFFGCSGLTEITIPNSVTSIGGGAFEYCFNLTSITIPDSVTSIGVVAFADCTKLTSITILNPNCEIDDRFSTLSDTATIYGYENSTAQAYAEKYDYKFESLGEAPVHAPESYFKYETLDDGTIEITGCDSSVTKVEIPAEIDGKKVTSIGNFAFWGKGLTSVTIPDSVTSIGSWSFQNCPDLTSITIPDSVTSIGKGAFSGCSSLMEITILNPDCEIYDSEYTILNYYDENGFYFNGTICGYENSTAQAYAEKYDYKFESLGEAPATKVIAGDANCDGKVSIADSTAILQHLGNQDKYGLSAEGLQNADVDENDGVSTNDALVIQMVDAKLLTVEQLPLKK